MLNSDTELYRAHNPAEYLMIGCQELVKANLRELLAIKTLPYPSVLMEPYVTLEGVSYSYLNDDETQDKIKNFYDARQDRLACQRYLTHKVFSTFLHRVIEVTNLSSQSNIINEMKYSYLSGSFQQKRFPSSVEARIGGIITTQTVPVLELYKGKRTLDSPHTIYHVTPTDSNANRLINLKFLDL